MENIEGGSGNDILTGSNADNHIEGGSGNDSIKGLDGDDSPTRQTATMTVSRR